ncbi:MAG: preprotein translocase subunit YajC [Clostridiales bacterium]|nr:preprotein translocase subunit YajC [Clostridiales bacterium]
MINNLIGAIQPSTIVMLVLLAVMVIVLIVWPMFTNSRRNRAINDLHSSLRAGDVIKTVGGIVGTILEIKEVGPLDKEMVVETGVGDNKCTMVFDIQAVYQVVSKANAPVENAAPAIGKEAVAEEAVAPAEEVKAEAEAPATEETAAAQTSEPVQAAGEAPAEEAKAEESAAAKRKTTKK